MMVVILVFMLNFLCRFVSVFGFLKGGSCVGVSGIWVRIDGVELLVVIGVFVVCVDVLFGRLLLILEKNIWLCVLLV